jgi:hypothetical protein
MMLLSDVMAFVTGSCSRRPRRIGMGRAIFFACAVHVVSFSSSAARDLDAMAEILVPAYTAMNYALICGRDDPRFLPQTLGARGTVLSYAEHVKDEVIESISHEELVVVLTKAADKARSIAREELRRIVPTYPTGRADQIVNWCYGAAMQFVRAFIEHHDGEHDAILQELERARESEPARPHQR